MIVKVCDRCRKMYKTPSPLSQAKLGYIITVVEGFPLNTRHVDLCDECQDDLDKWMNEKLGEGEDDNEQ